MRVLRAFLLVLAFAALQPALAFEPVSVGRTQLRFATLAEARAELSRDDEWVAATSDFERALIAKASRPVSRAEFRDIMARKAVDWTDSEVARWRAAVEAAAPRLAALRLPLPPAVTLVVIDGTDPGNVPHTRGQAIFLPRGFSMAPGADDLVMAHELFHVSSRANPQLASRIYSLFGFEPVAPLEWPQAWQGLNLTNPDAPQHRHAITLEHEGRMLRVMPVLVARHTQPSPGDTVFNVLDVRLLVLAPAEPGEPSRAQLQGTEPQWLPAYRSPAYHQRTGGNTRYLHHPEEIAADNFMLLASGRPAPNPGLLRQLEALLREAVNQEEKK